MHIPKKVKIAVGSLLGLGLLFFVVLIVHIAIMVKNKQPIANATIQMARIDFKQPMDGTDIAKLEGNLKSIKGVRDTYYNPLSNILIYSFDNRVTNAQTIYDIAIPASGYAANRFLFAKNDAAKGCPVMDDHSFYGKLTSVVSSVVN